MTENCGKLRSNGIANQHPDERNPKQSTPYRFWPSKRFLILILLFCGYFFAIVVRVCINIAIIEMTMSKTKKFRNETIHQPAEFNWDTNRIGVVLASHSYGYIFSVFGGYLATKFGGSIVYGGFSAFTALLTASSPILLRRSFSAFITGRILAGLFDGIAVASTAEVFSRWIPARERSRFMSIIFSGAYISVAVSYPTCGYVAYFWGWPAIFYLAGGCYFIWSVIWLSIVRNQPSEDGFISKKELEYILSETETSSRNQVKHPYRKILTSAPVLALGISKFAYGIGFNIIVTYLPQYAKDVTKREINEIGVISSIPNFICIVMTPIVGVIMDYLQNNRNLRPSQIHKILMSFGFISGSVLFVVAAFSTNFTLSMTCFVLIKLFLSFNYLIQQLVYLYLAPRHSSVLLGLTMGWYVMCCMAMPTAVGFVVVNHTLDEWSTCFLIAAGILMFAAIVYAIYGSSELQPWAVPQSSDRRSDDIGENYPMIIQTATAKTNTLSLVRYAKKLQFDE